jgi:hypothetical protein
MGEEAIVVHLLEMYDPIKFIATKKHWSTKRLHIITTLIETIQGEKFLEFYASRMPPRCQKQTLENILCLSQTQRLQNCTGMPYYRSLYSPNVCKSKGSMDIRYTLLLTRSSEALSAWASLFYQDKLIRNSRS